MKNDLTNQTFGMLTAKEIVGKDKRGYLWRCKCECGGEKIVPVVYLRNGHTRSCGCINAQRKAKLDITGQRWGRLVAIKHVGYVTKKSGNREQKQSVWLWQCDCGNTKEIPASDVKHGGTRSCGCKATEHITNLKRKDITGETYDRLTAIRPTEERDGKGCIIWEFQCECGNTTKLSVNSFHSGRVHSCGCLYREFRATCVAHRRDLVECTSLSSIVSTKKRPADPTKFPGVYFDKRSKKWHSYITYQKKRIFLGSSESQAEAIKKRQEAEMVIHDPIVIDHVDNLTADSRATFLHYLTNQNDDTDK